ncbi:pentatricopeptide repeat-containing protein At5g57250, mitochondrial [Abrus precatorius]|uniref:Pentatricopeptide repeat-containing protein At5g57250, mitochondrial n=1 Tax=Abrus precatorius TaxID=3816 RepID=A0A8B8M7W3_ABRPR|nr:pentatricopeptide repeat-containing protein At5g57250, mitochondrial [Abrus precatorius]XP_027363827.1 pentatricopeptide repeat-containing protein At5g57250, mitochondrial [Abrus precatorius]XP_027363835.1 pentatricopeptide repeat-containing protein At5g57250, mitochondrial [Abrus precatorius]XP_027363843.1 pentatricopeptide repeat-containing protein At5g57250, mitochondrial [Abrus precatorius]XP_027363852.1 pentatricopeptide repeat-containing protein At5g57250, mitochondrial [Abrus precator
MSFHQRPFSSQALSLQTLLKRGFTPTLKPINRFILFLFNLHKFDLIIHLFSQFNTNNVPVNHQTRSILTWALLKSHRFEEAEQFMNTHMHITHSFMWDSLIQGFCVKHQDPERALSVLQSCIRDHGVLPSSFTFCSIVHKLSSKGLMGKAIEVLELMAEDGVKYPFDDFVCSSVISGFCRIGKPELALGFFQNATGSGLLRPNVVTCTALVGALCKLGRVDEVCDLVQWMEKEGLGLDVVLYSAWAYGYVEGKDLVEVFRRMREMVEKGFDHDVVSYTILVDGFSKFGDVEKSFTFLAKMIKGGCRPNKVTFSAIMSAFCKKGKVEEAFTVFKSMKDLGIELDEFVFVILIDGFGRRGDFDNVFCLFDEMEKSGISPSVVTFNAVINGLSKYGRTSEADEFSKDVSADVITYSTLLHGYTEEENITGILQTKRRLEEAGIAMDVVMCNVLIKALFMIGAFEDVYALYKGMLEMNLVPNSVTYCTMIDGYCKVGRIDKALEVFDQFRKTSISSDACYNSIINGLCKMGMEEMAIEALRELSHKGLELDIGTYRMLMNTIFKENNTKEALDLVYRMEGLGPDIYDAVCNDSIFLLCQRGLVDDANQLCMMMKRKGLCVTTKSYYLISRGHLCSGNREQILPLLNSFLKEHGLVEPMVQKILACYLCLKDVNSTLRFLGKTVDNSSAVTFPVSILKILVKEGRALDAFKLVMESQDNLPVMYVDYAIVIDGLCKEGYINKALDLCASVENKGMNLNIVIYNSIINGLCHEGRLIEAFRLFDSLEKLNLIPSEITYATLIYALCREGFLLDAEHVFRKMILKGFQPKIQVYNSILNGICKFGQLEKAFEFLNDMEMNNIEPDNLTVSAVINCYCQKGEMEGALEYYNKFKRKDISPDFLGFLYLIRGLCAKGRMEETRSVMIEMLQSKDVTEIINLVNKEVETESISDFMAALCKEGRIQEAVTVLNEIACILFPVQRLSTYNQAFHKQQKIYEWNDFGSKSSSILPSSCKSSLSFGSCDEKDVRNLSTVNGSCMTRSQLPAFDFYYSRIAALCAKGELQKANQSAKEMLSDLMESIN